MANQSLLYELDHVMPEARLLGLFSNSITFRDRPGGATPQMSSSGQVNLTDLVDVPGLVNIPCQFSVHRPFNVAIQGARRPDHFVEEPEYHVLLNDYYPAILQRYTAIVDGMAYEITPGAVEHDSQKQQTRVGLRRYEI